MSGLTKNDSTRIGFVTSCLFHEAVNLSELHQWVLHVLENETETPPYLLEFLEFNGPLFKIYKIIGFVPPWPGTDDEKLALFGIAYKRGRQPYECPISREAALAKLEQCQRIRETFVTTFPFLTLGA